ncbi:MAG TPA: glycosyltransferase [Steroidobacter sp.]|uniref:glycosyltransferase n=1 Tax=Steroidobacter sp. TaxID=1978227 RepID=UPI002EDA5AED
MSSEASSFPTSQHRSILHVITGLEVGGAETVLAHVARASMESGQRILVAAIRGGGGIDDRLRAAGVPLVYVQRGSAPADSRVGFLQLLRECARFSPDVIVGWMYHGVVLAEVVGRSLGRSVPVVWNFRCTIDDSPNWPLPTRAIIRMLGYWSGRARKLIYNSEAGRQQHEQYGYACPRSIVIGNGVDTNRFAPDPQTRALLRAELGIGRDTVVFGHVARFHRMKAHPLLLEAAELANFSREVCIVMAGKDVDASNAALAEHVERLKRKCRVVLLGPRSDVHRLMNAFDVLCLTSSGGEGFPNVLAEAMSSGVPCISTDVGDAARIIGTTGSVVPPDDPRAFAVALERAASWSSEERHARASAARTLVVEKFSLQQMISAYDELFTCVTRE